VTNQRKRLSYFGGRKKKEKRRNSNNKEKNYGGGKYCHQYSCTCYYIRGEGGGEREKYQREKCERP
jgi:hypothetical protein